MFVLKQCGALLMHRMTDLQKHIITKRNIHRIFASSSMQPQKENWPIISNAHLIQRRGHKNFGHEKETTPTFTKIYHSIIGMIFFVTIIDWKKVKRMCTPKVHAVAGSEDNDIEVNEEHKTKSYKKNNKNENATEKEKDIQREVDSNKSGDEVNDNNEKNLNAERGDLKSTKSKKEKIGFRERKILEYEQRIRQFSSPDKVFRYFATVSLITPHETLILMTPDDFLRAICPGFRQPDGLGLDQYKRYDPKSLGECLNLKLEKGSIFYKLGSYGLITFSDYIFLLTVLSTSRRHFEIAFQMFDLNGDGDVDSDEFERVANLARQQSSIGRSHRDHANTGNTFKGVNSALITYFFGRNLDNKLTITKFLEFQHQLQREILSLEFERKNPNDDGKINEVDFAELLLAYAGLNAKNKQRKLKRVKKMFRHNGQGVTKKDYLDFFHFINNITDVDTALTFYHIAGASIDQATLKHVAKTVAKVELSDHVINVVFAIFDDNDDNQLSNREFIAVMKNRVQRGLEKPKDTGFLKLIQSVIKCAQETKPVLLDL